MKKISMWKRIGMAVMATALVSMFASCGNPVTGSDDDDTGGTGNNGTTPSTAVIPEGALVVADFTIASTAPDNVTLPTWGFTPTIKSDSTYKNYLDLDFTGDDKNAGYAQMEINLKEPTDLTGKTIYTILKGKKSDQTKISISSDSTEEQHSSEALLVSADKTIWGICENPVSGMWAAWDGKKNDSGEAADIKKVEKLTFFFQQETNPLKIAAIYIK